MLGLLVIVFDQFHLNSLAALANLKPPTNHATSGLTSNRAGDLLLAWGGPPEGPPARGCLVVPHSPVPGVGGWEKIKMGQFNVLTCGLNMID